MEFGWYIPFIKLLFVNFCISYATIRIINHKINERNFMILIICFNIIFAIIYSMIRKYVEIIYLYPIYYLTYSVCFSMLINIRILYGVTVTMISSAFSLISIIIASIINFFIMKVLSLNIINYNKMEYIVIGIIEFMLIFSFFKIKRFKNGFSFLKNKKIVNILGALIGLILILVTIVIAISKNYFLRIGLINGVFLCTIGFICWIRKNITKYYKERMKDRTVELQSEKLKEKDEIIANLNKELSNVLEINHKYNKRLSAMEKAIGNFGDKWRFNEEFAKEYSDILDSLKDLSKEYKQEFENYNILPKTNIFSIDNLLDYMKTEAIRNNIEFDLEINGNINELIEKHISKNKLETLLGDHIADAIIAINASDSSDRRIKVIIGKSEELYKISILDTGKEFEIETLSKLGLERITTHKDSGGTGIGFMTTFEALKECKASLVIEEYNNENDYTKSVNIIFDGKSEYRIKSYRVIEIELKNNTNRIILEKI